MAEFVMPTLGADMSAGTLVAWKKKPGDRVTRGEVIAEVETDKAAIDVEVFASGMIEKLLVQPGEQVPVGTVMAIIREEGQPASASVAAPLPPPTTGEVPVPPPSPVRAAPPSPLPAVEPSRMKISPSAKQLAAQLGVDPAKVRGTGPESAITREDIERASAKPVPPAEPEAGLDRMGRMRQAIAAAMARSKREIPHYYLGNTIDMSRAMTWLTDENRKRAVTDRLLYGVLLIKAVALALREVPELNAVWKEGQAAPSQGIHVGVAISLRGGGLVAPALHDADRQSLDELMRNFRDLVKRARAGTLRSSELSDPTITVTSLGEQGVETVFGVIYPPQVALVGFGKVVERPWVAESRVEARPVVTATLSADHRVTDGHRGGLFLAAVDRLLQEPSRL
ncbi:MAG: 2-oxo acid dehydrogenase subunit E2 [Nitrospirae bacterium]|nr:MAG: 2-oxo acid dehydrogenase subunit E2 [Nitrospirota bacterium]